MADATPRPPRARVKASSETLVKIRSVGRSQAPWDDFYHWILTSPWTSFFALNVGWFVTMNSFFAFLYLLQPGCVSNAHTFEDVFFFSVESFSTIGFGVMTPLTRYAHILVSAESLCGILSTALITGVTFAKFARPTARVLFANKIVIGNRDGAPTMSFRLANFRNNSIAEATIRVILLTNQTSAEGEHLRVPVELKLVRERTATFMLTWMVMHTIDKDSPFHGDGAIDRHLIDGAELFLSLTGVDDTMGQTILARKRYGLQDIVQNARFKDVLHTAADGARVIDYSDFHDTVPHPATAPLSVR